MITPKDGQDSKESQAWWSARLTVVLWVITLVSLVTLETTDATIALVVLCMVMFLVSLVLRLRAGPGK